MPDFRDLLLPRLTLRYDFAEIGRRIMIKAQKAPREWRATKTAKRVAFYLRVSTGGQTTANQRRELAAVAKRHGWNVVNVFSDNGSGAKDRKERPGLDALLKAVARREIDTVVAWSVDRLGRSLKNLIEVLSDLHAKGVGLYLHQQGLDTSTPSGRAMFQMMGVFAEFERAIIRERVLSGISVTPSALALGDPRSASANYEITETSVNGGRCYRC
jgi:Resolvase, N terminal domain